MEPRHCERSEAIQGRLMEPRHCERSEAIQGRHTHSLDRFVASLLAMTPYHQVMILSTSSFALESRVRGNERGGPCNTPSWPGLTRPSTSCLFGPCKLDAVAIHSA